MAGAHHCALFPAGCVHAVGTQDVRAKRWMHGWQVAALKGCTSVAGSRRSSSCSVVLFVSAAAMPSPPCLLAPAALLSIACTAGWVLSNTLQPLVFAHPSLLFWMHIRMHICPILIQHPAEQWADALHRWLGITDDYIHVVHSGKDAAKIPPRIHFLIASYNFVPKMASVGSEAGVVCA